MDNIPKFYMDPEAAQKQRKVLKSGLDDVFVVSQGTRRDAVSFYVLNVRGKKINFRARWSGVAGDDGQTSVRHVLLSIGWAGLFGEPSDIIVDKCEQAKYVDYCVAALKAYGGNIWDPTSWEKQAEVELAPELAGQLGEGTS